MLVTSAGSLFCSFCLIFSNISRLRKFLVAFLELEINYRLCVSRNLYMGNFHWKRQRVLVRPYKQNLRMPFFNKTRFPLSHFISRKWLMFSLVQYWPEFYIFPLLDSKFHFSPSSSANYLWWTRNQSEKCLKHMTWSTLIKCGSMIV